jgi:SAM-dependent methyltransferase
VDRESPGQVGRRDGARHLCEGLLDRWDPMFAQTIDPTRPRRMEAILEALSDPVELPSSVLDLGCGPGPLEARLMTRFPECHVVAVDTDPVLLRVGREALHRYPQRIDWVLADVREVRWPSRLPVRQFDAAVSSLTLHWLWSEEVRAIYRAVHRHLRAGGRFVNADYLPSRRPARPAGRLRRTPHRRPVPGDLGEFRSEWEKWWEAVARERSLASDLRARRKRLPGPFPPRRIGGPRRALSLEFHERALRGAGFREVRVVWHDGEFRALVGVR